LIFSSLYMAICAARTEYSTVNTTSSGISTNSLTKARFLEFEGTGSGRTLIVGWAAASEAMESVGVGIIAVFGAAGGACGPNAADQTKSHHQPRLPQLCNLFRPFCVSTTQRRNAQRRAATFTTNPLGHHLHTAPIPHVQHNRDRDRHRKCNRDDKQQQRDGYSAHAG
jgi:hypothetical protein